MRDSGRPSILSDCLWAVALVPMSLVLLIALIIFALVDARRGDDAELDEKEPLP